jgi:hypothetical protein
MAKKKILFSWSKFATTNLVSAVVANAAKSDAVLTFKSVKPFTYAIASEFTFSGKTVDHIHVDPIAKTVTVNVTVAWANGNSISCVYNPRKGATVTIPVTNNVA